MTLPIHGLYSNFSLTEDLILNRSYKFKQQLLIKENMARYYQNKKPTKADKTIMPVSTITWKDDDKEEREREKSRNTKVQKKDTSGIKVVGRSLMSDNELRKINQNSVHDKLLYLKKKDLDKQLKHSLTKLKREKTILVEKYIDLQANNYKFIKNIERNSRLSNPRVTSVLSINRGYVSPSLYIRSIQSAPAKLKHSSFDVFRHEMIDLESRISSAYKTENVPERLLLKTPDSFKSHLEVMKEKFVDQKLRCNPSYQKKKRKNRYSMTLEDFDKAMAARGSEIESCFKKKICTKYKQHKLAQHGADIFLSNKLISQLNKLKHSDKEIDLLEEINGKDKMSCKTV